MYVQYGDKIEFFVVYIREAHPTDGRRSPSNDKAGIKLTQPKSFDERTKIASQMCSKLELSLPTLIDHLDDQVGRDYSAMPDRLYLVGKDGRVAFQGERGPRGFKPAELEKAIRAELEIE